MSSDTPISTDTPDWRTPAGRCSSCGAETYDAQVRGQSKATYARHHIDNGQPGDADCQRIPGQPHLRASALARWAYSEEEQHRTSPNHAQTWSNLAEHVAQLHDDEPDILFFHRRGAFDQLNGIVYFIPAQVPPLDSRDDFLSGFGGMQALDGPTALSLLVKAVRSREARSRS